MRTGLQSYNQFSGDSIALYETDCSPQITETAVEFLSAARAQDDPFLLAVGLHKPHIPHKFPAQFLDYHPDSSVSLPANSHPPAKLPPVAWAPWAALRRRKGWRFLQNIS